MADSGDSSLMSRAELARASGVSSTTLRNWTERADRPLRTTVTPARRTMFTRAALLEFCEQHPELRAAAKARQRLTRSTSPAPVLIFDQDEADLRASLADMKAAVDSALEALEHAARQARDVADAQSKIVAALRRTVRAYDSAMTSATVPHHPPSNTAH